MLVLVEGVVFVVDSEDFRCLDIVYLNVLMSDRITGSSDGADPGPLTSIASR